jgi:hypothetical protein
MNVDYSSYTHDQNCDECKFQEKWDTKLINDSEDCLSDVPKDLLSQVIITNGHKSHEQCEALETALRLKQTNCKGYENLTPFIFSCATHPNGEISQNSCEKQLPWSIYTIYCNKNETKMSQCQSLSIVEVMKKVNSANEELAVKKIEKVLRRGDKIDNLVEKSDELSGLTKTFHANSLKMNSFLNPRHVKQFLRFLTIAGIIFTLTYFVFKKKYA